MTLEDLYALIEQKYNDCEEDAEGWVADDEGGRLDGFMEALQWVMKQIEESDSETEL